MTFPGSVIASAAKQSHFRREIVNVTVFVKREHLATASRTKSEQCHRDSDHSAFGISSCFQFSWFRHTSSIYHLLGCGTLGAFARLDFRLAAPTINETCLKREAPCIGGTHPSWLRTFEKVVLMKRSSRVSSISFPGSSPVHSIRALPAYSPARRQALRGGGASRYAFPGWSLGTRNAKAI